MSRHDDDEEAFFESIGRIPRRGDKSRSPTPLDRQNRSRSADGPRTTSSQCQTELHTSQCSKTIRSWVQDAGTAASAPYFYVDQESEMTVDPHTAVSKALSHNINNTEDKADSNSADHPEGRHINRGRSLEVKKPIEEENLTEDEFSRYQARYGQRHKVSANQIIHGMSNEDAEDPTLGNRRTQNRLSEDGTIDRRDFDRTGGFRYVSSSHQDADEANMLEARLTINDRQD